MGLFDFRDPHEALADLLSEERKAILSADFEKLEQFAIDKERLMDAVAKTRVDATILSQLREQTERNGILYDAMRSGIGSAIDRIRALREPRPALRTYDEAGRSNDISQSNDTPVRRA